MKTAILKTNLRQPGKALRIIITGGTFDKHYDPLRGELGFSNTHLPEILRFSRCTLPITLQKLQLKDSLHMTQGDRLKILSACRKAEEQQIIITHGTDTMAETARLIGEAGLGRRIVLTGAMIPYSVIGSDAVFNLGCSITAVQLCDPGTYICMNGRLFPYDQVRKNPALGTFEALDSHPTKM